MMQRKPTTRHAISGDWAIDAARKHAECTTTGADWHTTLPRGFGTMDIGALVTDFNNHLELWIADIHP